MAVGVAVQRAGRKDEVESHPNEGKAPSTTQHRGTRGNAKAIGNIHPEAGFSSQGLAGIFRVAKIFVEEVKTKDPADAAEQQSEANETKCRFAVYFPHGIQKRCDHRKETSNQRQDVESSACFDVVFQCVAALPKRVGTSSNLLTVTRVPLTRPPETHLCVVCPDNGCK